MSIIRTYLVGGAVRDRLLGRPVSERDWLVTGARPDDLLQQGYRQVGRDFPVFLHPQTQEEYALARTERKSGQGYHGFICEFSPAITLEQDLERRDLTINAMAEDENGDLIDPYGGQQDLAARLLRHVSPAFVEDPLRVLRVARFAARYAALGFRVADETLALMQHLSQNGELATLTPERVWKETERALCEASPRTYIEVLRRCGALKILLPEIDALFGVPQRAEYHPEIDTGEHLLLVLDQVAAMQADSSVRFAALLHDLGKGVTPTEEWPRHLQHEARGVPLVKAVCSRMKVPREHQELALLVCRLHLDAHRAWQLKPETLLRKLRELDALRRPERLQAFLQACAADARGRLGLQDNDYRQRDYWLGALQCVRAIRADDVVDKSWSGAAIGRAMEKCQIAALHGWRQQWQAREENTCPSC